MASALAHELLLSLLHAGSRTGSGFGGAGDPRARGTPEPLTQAAHSGMSVERNDSAVCAHVVLTETILVLNPLEIWLRKGSLHCKH